MSGVRQQGGIRSTPASVAIGAPGIHKELARNVTRKALMEIGHLVILVRLDECERNLDLVASSACVASSGSC